MKKRLLFIAYFYPPLGGPGVQRPLKTIKYLKEHGWHIDVLSVSDIQFHSYDHELLNESRADNIYRTSSLDLMSLYKKKSKAGESKEQGRGKANFSVLNKLYFNTPEGIKKVVRGLFPIDDKIGWLPFAYKKALELLKVKRYDAVVSTIGPYTSGVLAYRLHKKTNIPIFVDYRDHWTLHSYPQYNLRSLHKHAEKYEKKMLEAAEGVFVISNLMKQKMVEHFGEYLEQKTQVVYNGYDEPDFSSLPADKPESEVITVRYIGNFYGNRNVEHFVRALKVMKFKNELPERVKFEFIGNYYTETKKLLESPSLMSHIKIIEQVPHSEAVRLMQTADLLLLFIPSIDGVDFMTGKVFEYIRACVPVLAMIPEDGEPAKILKELGHNYICRFEDIKTIREYLNDFINKREKLGGEIRFDNKYSRESQTAIFNDFINERLTR